MNSIRDPHVAENSLESQTFWLLKKKKQKQKQRQKRKRIWETQNALPKRTLSIKSIFFQSVPVWIQLFPCLRLCFFLLKRVFDFLWLW